MPIIRTMSNRPLPASGRSIANPGRIAGGAPGIDTRSGSVFPRSVFHTLLHGNRPGGLIDKKQQVNPESTQFGHPFDADGYISVSSQEIIEPIGNWNGFAMQTSEIPELQPHEHGTFFQTKVKPIVKTIGGAAGTQKSDTTFHPKPKIKLPRPTVVSSIPTEKISRRVKPPSFVTANTLRMDPNNSHHGIGRWSQVKRGASESYGALL